MQMACQLRWYTAKVKNKIGLINFIVCDVPPEYCMADKKDNTECKNWLKTAHPDLYARIYPDEENKVEGEEGKAD